MSGVGGLLKVPLGVEEGLEVSHGGVNLVHLSKELHKDGVTRVGVEEAVQAVLGGVVHADATTNVVNGGRRAAGAAVRRLYIGVVGIGRHRRQGLLRRSAALHVGQTANDGAVGVAQRADGRVQVGQLVIQVLHLVVGEDCRRRRLHALAADNVGRLGDRVQRAGRPGLCVSCCEKNGQLLEPSFKAIFSLLPFGETCGTGTVLTGGREATVLALGSLTTSVSTLHTFRDTAFPPLNLPLVPL